MKITIVGGGNIGTQFAVHCAEKGHDVIIFTSTPEIYDGYLYIVDENGNKIHEGNIKLATDNPVVAFARAEMIFVTVPPALMREKADVILKYANDSAIIAIVPGNGGGECAFRECIERGNVFFGMERVPAIARLTEKGKCVRSVGYRKELHVAALPKRNAAKCADIVGGIFDIPTKVIPEFLSLTMTPSNPILHTTRLNTIFKDWHEGMSYKSVPLFYEEWDDKSSELLMACDEEVQTICENLPEYDLKTVKSLKVYYESYTLREMTEKLRSIPAFKGLKTPVLEKDGLYVPDFQSRYFTSDFAYGLKILKQIAEFANVKTPFIDDVLRWYEEISHENQEFRYADYGIKSRTDFDSFYSL